MLLLTHYLSWLVNSHAWRCALRAIYGASAAADVYLASRCRGGSQSEESDLAGGVVTMTMELVCLRLDERRERHNVALLVLAELCPITAAD